MQDFTSLSPQEEQQFVVFERRSVNTGKAAMTLALIIAGALFVSTVFVVLAFKPEMHNVVEEADAKAEAEAKAKDEAKAKARIKAKATEAAAAATAKESESDSGDESDE